jgi:large subunit ribosomal protein L33
MYRIVERQGAANGGRVRQLRGRCRPRALAAGPPDGYHLPLSRPRKEAEGSSMAKGKKKLEVIHLVCSETGDQNYTLRRKSGGEKLKVKKYSPRLRKHTLHNEKKK